MLILVFMQGENRTFMKIEAQMHTYEWAQNLWLLISELKFILTLWLNCT